MYGRGDAAAAGDEGRASCAVHWHNWRAAKEAAEFGPVAFLFSGYGNYPDGGGLVVHHTYRHFIGDYGGDR